MKITIKTRKIANKPFTNVSINVVKDDGSTHSKQWVCKGGKSKAKGEIFMFLKNVTQKAKLVNYPV